MSVYRRKDGWWSDELHLAEGGKPMNFKPDVDLAISKCKKHDVCIQAGGFIGVWPKYLSKHFERVLTFEVVPELYECMVRNTEDCKNVELFPMALGHVNELEKLFIRSGGRSLVGREGNTFVKQLAVDSLDLPACDAMFIDVEGWETQVFRGARKTIERFSPVIQAELLLDYRYDVLKCLYDLGYKLVGEVSKCDGVFVR